jgi:hypothetical protein
LAVAGLSLLLGVADAKSQAAEQRPPQRLEGTGLYSDFATLVVDANHIAFSPQYPLWTDGAAKRRWISIPAGAVIDGSDAEAWVFPVGTRVWKEFSFSGRRVETRFMERGPDGWTYAAYAWREDGRDAVLVSERGRRNAYPLGAERSHTIPGANDCKACHQGGRAEVLGFSALQLSPDRDPGALHADAGLLDIEDLIEKGLLVGVPQERRRPRIEATSAAERTALGYLHGNCGHCHNDHGSLKNIGLSLRHVSGAVVPRALESTIDQPVRKLAPGQSPDAILRVEPRHPERSGLVERIGSRYPALQMPPLGTELVDEEAVALIRRWVAERDVFWTEAHLEEREHR